ncbi:MAG: XTP/dITP diphosphatase [Ruminococcus sp.]|nr:XTP/dITP diphosphatase [Candidatus Apopatosoma intestinale]
MKPIVIASNNQHKIAEIRAILETVFGENLPEVKSLAEIGYDKEIVEDGTTFEENAAIKAKTIASLGYIAIADDSGLCVDALDGAPGIFSARYAGEEHDDEANNRKLLRELENVPDENRGAKFVSVICLAYPDGRTVTARGECPGKILRTYRGTAGFGYDPLFFYEPAGQSFAELSGPRKNAISHRARSLAAFAEKMRGEKLQ